MSLTFTYSGDPSSSTIDSIRFEIGDTQDNQHLVEDAEILYAYAKEGTVLKAAARICTALAARFASREEFRGATIQTSKATISGKFLTLAKSLRARSLRSGGILMPALSETTKETHEQDTDIPQPSFKKGLMDNPDVETDDDSDYVD
jgi:hypothetical protein